MVESDALVRDILVKTRTVAVVGIKNAETDDAFRIPRYMQQMGYQILPVNPKFDAVLGESAVSCLAELSEPVDLINLFRASDHIPTHADEILAMPHRPLAVWMQLGIHCGSAANRLRAAGIQVVQDRCIMVEHRRLLGGS